MVSERIGSEEAIRDLPQSMRSLIELERFHLYNVEHWQNTSNDPAFDTRYFPQNCGAFVLPCFWIRRKHLYIYESGPTACRSELSLYFRSDDPSDCVLFPIHPLTLKYYESFLARVEARNVSLDGLRVMAVPTSSLRTLIAWPAHDPKSVSFVKTTLPDFGNRRIHASKAGYAVGVTKILDASRNDLPSSFRYFPEAVGFVPREMPDSGVLLRSAPASANDQHTLIVPLFALLGGSGSRLPLFLRMISRCDTDPMELLEQVFCDQFCRLWLELSLCHGLLPEFHAQNLLIGLSPDFTPLGQFYYRDFNGLLIDWQLRRARSLPDPRDLPRAESWYETYGTLRVGAPYCELVWWKVRVSLFAYLDLFLNELSECIHRWQRLGLIGHAHARQDIVMELFSRSMSKHMQQMFGFRCALDYNIHRSLNRFVSVFMQLRKDVVSRIH